MIKIILISVCICSTVFAEISMKYRNFQEDSAGIRNSHNSLTLGAAETLEVTSYLRIRGAIDLHKEYQPEYSSKSRTDVSLKVTSLYLEGALTDNIAISAGVIPFTSGFLTEVSGRGDTDKGNGISSLVQTSYDAMFLTLRNDIGCFVTLHKLGYGYYKKFNLPIVS